MQALEDFANATFEKTESGIEMTFCGATRVMDENLILLYLENVTTVLGSSLHLIKSLGGRN